MSRTQDHSCWRSVRLAWLVALAAGVVVWPTRLMAAETPVPPKRHAEEMVFDENAGQWKQTVSPVPGTEDGDLDIARQWLSRGQYKTVLKIVKAWIGTYGTSAPRYPEALYLKGTAYLEQGLYKEAHEAYQALLSDFPASPYAEEALSGDFRVAEQYLAGKRKRVWGGLLWFRDREGGVAIMDEMIANYSDTPFAELAQMAKADYYYSRGEFDVAESEYATFARNYPQSRWHARALLMSARSAEARFPGIKFDDAPLIEAQERFQQLQREYPAVAQQQGTATALREIASTRADKTLDIGKFYEKTKHPQAAKYYYRETTIRWPGTPAAIEARRRLAALGEPAGDEAEAAEGPQASVFRPHAEEPR
jgi:outer membrane protein assembly factor BamD (BamD/ComL family)